MNNRQTVKIFLAEGNPTGLRSLELFNWNGKGFIIPRDRMEAINGRSELQTQGVYILLGEEEGRQKIYVGESENVLTRLKSHNKNKDFWDTAITFFSKDVVLNKAHVKYLEELLIKEAADAGRVLLENGNQPQQTRLSESEEAETLLFAENIKLILSSIGYTFLKKPIEYEIDSKESADIYVCEGPDARAEAFYASEGIVVLKDSLIRKEFVQSVGEKDSFFIKRQGLIDEGVLIEVNDQQMKFSRDYVFNSPSTSAAMVLARNANGWSEWKRKGDKKTLDEIIRKTIDTEDTKL